MNAKNVFAVEPFMFLSVKIKNDWRTGTSVVDLVISVCIKYTFYYLVNFYKWNIYVHGILSTVDYLDSKYAYT